MTPAEPGETSEEIAATTTSDRTVRRPRRAGGEPGSAAERAPVDETTVRRRRTAAPAPDAPGSVPSVSAASRHPERSAYSPDPAALRAPYAARQADPVIAERTALPPRPSQPRIAGDDIDRSIRGGARRRAAWLGVGIGAVLVVGAVVLVALVSSFAR